MTPEERGRAVADRLFTPHIPANVRDRTAEMVAQAIRAAVAESEAARERLARSAYAMAGAALAWTGNQFPNHTPSADLRGLKAGLRALEREAKDAMSEAARTTGETT